MNYTLIDPELNPGHLALFESFYRDVELTEDALPLMDESGVIQHIAIWHPQSTLDDTLPQPSAFILDYKLEGTQLSIWRLSNPVYPYSEEYGLTEEEFRKKSGFNLYWMLRASLVDALGGREQDTIPSTLLEDYHVSFLHHNMAVFMNQLKVTGQWSSRLHPVLCAIGGSSTSDKKRESSQANLADARLKRSEDAQDEYKRVVALSISAVEYEAETGKTFAASRKFIERAYASQDRKAPAHLLSKKFELGVPVDVTKPVVELETKPMNTKLDREIIKNLSESFELTFPDK